MADYWKSTPKYWCKHCKLFVRDTPLEKRNHEASPRHQGNLQRFVKELHKTNAREEREAQRAKDEAARLNGDQLGTSSSAKPPLRSSGASSSGSGVPKQAPKATPEDRRRQMAQLAAMGVVVPEEYRKENAMTGEWESVAVHSVAQARPLRPQSKLKKEDSDDDIKPGLVDSSVAERKRKLEDGDGELDLTKGKRKPNWGSDVKQQREVDADDDLDALLAGSSSVIGRSSKKDANDKLELKDSTKAEEAPIEAGEADEDTKAGDILAPLEQQLGGGEIEPKDTDDAEDIGSMFKKRKKKKAL